MHNRASIPQWVVVRQLLAMFILLGLVIGLTRPVQAQMRNELSPLSIATTMSDDSPQVVKATVTVDLSHDSPLQQAVTQVKGATNSNFGYAIAISDDTRLVDAYLADLGGHRDRGAAYLIIVPDKTQQIIKDGLMLVQAAKLTDPEGTVGSQFGFSYDKLSRPATVIYPVFPDGEVVSYTSNTAGQLTRIYPVFPDGKV